MEDITVITDQNRHYFNHAHSEVSQRFVRDIERDFNRYQHAQKFFYSQRRSEDISKLRKILHNMPHETLLDCIAALKGYLNTIGTGWWIFETGHSTLKKYVLKTLADYSDPEIEAVLKDIAQNSTSEFMTLTEAIAIQKKHDGAGPDNSLRDNSMELIDGRLLFLKNERKRRRNEQQACWNPHSLFSETTSSDEEDVQDIKEVPAGPTKTHLNCHLMARII